MLAAAVVVTVLSMDGTLDRRDGVILLAVLVANIIYVVRTELTSCSGEVEGDACTTGPDDSSVRRLFPLNTMGQVAQFAIGAATVAVGSRFLVSSATAIAEMLGISEKVIGLTIVALGTSLPELATALTALIKGYQSLSAGNVVGANFINLTAVLGFASIVNPVPVGSSTVILDYPVMLGAMGALILFAATKRTLARWEGCVLLAGMQPISQPCSYTADARVTSGAGDRQPHIQAHGEAASRAILVSVSAREPTSSSGTEIPRLLGCHLSSLSCQNSLMSTSLMLRRLTSRMRMRSLPFCRSPRTLSLSQNPDILSTSAGKPNLLTIF